MSPAGQERNRVRFVVAGVIAPPIGIVVTLLAAVLTLEPTGGPPGDTIASFSHVLFFFMFFGLPPSYVVELALGVPLYRALRARGRLTLWSVALPAGVAGGTLFASAMLLFFPMDPSEGLLALFVLGALGGTVSGMVLWFIAVSRGISQPTPSSHRMEGSAR